MRFVLTEKIKQKVEVDVEFPIYREHSCENGSFFARTDMADGKFRRIQFYKDTDGRFDDFEISLSNSLSDDSSADYVLGRGKYACSEAKFMDNLKEFQQKVNEAVAICGF